MGILVNKAKKSKKKLNRLFVWSIILVEILLLFLTAYCIFQSATGYITVFSCVAVSVFLIWLGVIIGYLAWSIYFYNINLGLTNESWAILKEKSEKAEKLREIGIEPTDETNPPEDNPYNSQSLGLPPGTVRATLTLTLMIGAVSLFIYSMGHPHITEGDSFLYDNFEFFKTAFLMMIAFYFGSRTLEFLRKDYKGITIKRFGKKNGEQNGKTGNGADLPLPETADLTEETVPTFGNSEAEISYAKKLTGLKNALLSQELNEKFEKYTENNIVSINKEIDKIYLTEEEITLAAKENNIEPAALLAVVDVESAKSGFLSDGRPKILFEGHKFWNHLKEKIKAGKIDVDIDDLAKDHPDILYPTWTKKYYIGGAGEYSRLEKAMLIDRDSALMSASWGKFQIMGENFKLAGFKNIDEFVEAQKLSEQKHLEAFLNFIKNTKSAGEQIIKYLQNKNWQGFARGYNGPGYSKNKYDLRLEEYYAKWATALNQDMRLELKRTGKSELQTMGEMLALDGNDNIFSCKTIELPWRENKINISCIPEGKYKVKKRYSDKFGHHFHILNVPGRSMILIHAGNYYSETKGCILVGSEHTDINSDGICDVVNSRITLGKLNQIFPENFEITIA